MTVRPATSALPGATSRTIGANRSLTRDRVVETFLQQEGHVTAEELFEAVRRQYPRIGRATVYRTLQRMVEAGIAHKLDFGEGRARYESSPGRPRHFHLVCQNCRSSSEFLSSDVESLLEEIAAARGFSSSSAVVQIHGLCEQCRTGKADPSIDGSSTPWVFARDALRIAMETESAASTFYARAARVVKDAAARKVFHQLAEEEREHRRSLETRYDALLAEHHELKSLPRFLFFKRPANEVFAGATQQLKAGMRAKDVFRAAMDCERGSQRFFQQYAERLEHSEAQHIFREFADEEGEHVQRLAALLGRGRRTPATR